MYHRMEISTRILALKIYRDELCKLLKILGNNSDEEQQIERVASFVRKMPQSDAAVNLDELRKLCRLYCSYRMSNTALMLEAKSQKKNLEDMMCNIKREVRHLIDIFEKADKMLKNLKKIETKQRRELNLLIVNEAGKFIELSQVFKEFVEISEKACSTELNPVEAGCEIRMLLHHLDFLSDKLMKN